jgi:hypothetical protein
MVSELEAKLAMKEDQSELSNNKYSSKVTYLTLF